jgi:hypothetical protein
MAQPITWQNVTQGDASTAWRALDSAGRSINTAFDGLQGVIKGSEDIQAKNDVAMKNNNTQSYLDQVAQRIRTSSPEQAQKDLASGLFDQLKASYGANIDHAAVRGAPEAMLDTHYKQVKQGVDFNNAMLDEKTAPLMDKFRQALYAKDAVGMEKYRTAYSDAGGKHSADLELAARNIGHENLLWDEQKKTWVRDQGKYESDLKVARANIAQSGAAVRASDAQVRSSDANIRALEDAGVERKDIRESAKKAAIVAATRQSLSDAGNLYASDGVYTGKQAGELMDLMVKGKTAGDNPEKRAKILERFAKGTISIDSPDGKGKVDVPIPYAALKQAILGSTDKVLSWNEGYADTAEKTLRNMLKDSYAVPQLDAQGQPVVGADGKPVVTVANKAVDDYAAFSQTLRNAITSPQVHSNAGSNVHVPPQVMPKRR